MKRWSKFLPFVFIFCAALAVRAPYLAAFGRVYYGAGMLVPQVAMARELVQGKGFVTDLGFVQRYSQAISQAQSALDPGEVTASDGQNPVLEPFVGDMPGYAVLLAALFKLTGHMRLMSLQVVQIVLDSLAAVGIVFIAGGIMSRRLALAAGYAYALFLPAARMSIPPLRDALMGPLCVAAVLLVLEAIRRRTITMAALVGLFVGIACYIRPTFLYLPALLVVAYAVVAGWRRALMMSAVGVGCAVLVLLPWGMHNLSATGTFQLTRSALWQTVWEGWGEFPNPMGAILSDEITFNAAKVEGFTGEYGTPAYEAFLRAKVISAIRAHPFWAVRAVGQRFFRAFFSRVDWIPWEGIKGTQGWSAFSGGLFAYVRQFPLTAFFKVLFTACDLMLPVLALVGTWLVLRRPQIDRVAPLIALWSVILYFLLVIGSTHLEPRYIQSLKGLYLPPAIIAVVEGYLFSRRRTGRQPRSPEVSV